MWHSVWLSGKMITSCWAECLSVCLSVTFYPHFSLHHQDEVWDVFRDLHLYDRRCLLVTFYPHFLKWYLPSWGVKRDNPQIYPPKCKSRGSTLGQRPVMAQWWWWWFNRWMDHAQHSIGLMQFHNWSPTATVGKSPAPLGMHWLYSGGQHYFKLVEFTIHFKLWYF